MIYKKRGGADDPGTHEMAYHIHIHLCEDYFGKEPEIRKFLEAFEGRSILSLKMAKYLYEDFTAHLAMRLLF